MRFCEFIDILLDASSSSNQGQFVLEIFSALCGEQNPKTANHEAVNATDKAFCSPCLPAGLSNPDDATYRKRLFQGKNSKYVGLSKPVKTDILRNQKRETFIAYCKLAFSDTVTKRLCDRLGISDKPQDVLFVALFEQFIEFAKSPDDNVAVVMDKHKITLNNNLPERNDYFSGRDDKLYAIEQQFRKEQHDTVNICQTVSGLGGIGKTQLAIEYAYRFCGNYVNCIWFVVAESSTTTQNYFRDFAKQFNLPLSEDYKPEELQFAVKSWLDANSNWLIIFDNIEFVDVIKPYLPQKIKGRIIITSRNSGIDFGQQLDLGVFDLDESIRFLRRRFSNNEELKMENYKFDDFDEYAPRLAERVGNLPLAIEQAAAYIRQVRYRISDYLELLGESSVDAFADKDAKALYYESVVSATWKISFDALSTSAQYVMNLCAYMAPDRIPVEFFVDMRHKLPSPLREELATKQTTNRVFRNISEFSLTSGDAYSPPCAGSHEKEPRDTR